MPKSNRRYAGIAAVIFAVIGCVSPITNADDAMPATQPTTQPAGTSVDALTADVEKQFGMVQDVLGSPDILVDPAKRATAAPQVMPSLKKLVTDFNGLITADPDNAREATDRRAEFTMFLSLFGDTDATQKLATEANSTDPAQTVEGKRSQLMVDWLSSAKNPDAQSAVVDKIETLAKAHPESIALTFQIYQMSQMGATSVDLSKRLVGLVTDVMKNEVAERAKAQFAAEEKLSTLENKPLVVAGKQPDGKPITTADWKGKVVLVDFWATWCGPCIEEIPHVADLYKNYHSKGLEVIGVANDASSDVLTKFLGENKTMEWPQILDLPSADGSNFGAFTSSLGIEGIPTMFVIDKKGIVRTVKGREQMDTLIPQLLDEK